MFTQVDGDDDEPMHGTQTEEEEEEEVMNWKISQTQVDIDEERMFVYYVVLLHEILIFTFYYIAF